MPQLSYMWLCVFPLNPQDPHEMKSMWNSGTLHSGWSHWTIIAHLGPQNCKEKKASFWQPMCKYEAIESQWSLERGMHK